MTVANRFVRSATWDGMADKEGFPTKEIDALLVELARGKVGIIISGHTYINQDGQAGPGQLGVYSDRHIGGFSRMTEAIHNVDGKIVLQLAHAGCHADPLLTGLEPLGPSVMKDEQGPFCRAMTEQEINRIVADFGHAAIRAREAGFDGIQLHAAHSYLMSQFLSPFYNRREDDYGGNVENRARIVLEVLSKVRSEVGDDYPVMIKMNSEDFVDGGFSIDEMLQTSAMLEKAGIDVIELSGGTRYSGKYGSVRQDTPQTIEEEVYYLQAAQRYKEYIRVPLMLVGGIRSYEVAERLATESVADYISLSRPFIREPHLIERWEAGDRRKASCIYCNLCMKAAREEHSLYCVVEEGLQSKRSK
jgi:2,4-dienoyl-CoA reductase-like NADH-dependent reductase (Old Yellow Enzyme family)